jgi:hypothetical protein
MPRIRARTAAGSRWTAVFLAFATATGARVNQLLRSAIENPAEAILGKWESRHEAPR